MVFIDLKKSCGYIECNFSKMARRNKYLVQMDGLE